MTAIRRHLLRPRPRNLVVPGLGTACLVAGLVALGLLLAAPASQADDRDLLRSSAGRPYVLILFDTSGSMNETARCSQEQFDAGACAPLCPTGDCFVPLKGDDPDSKFYQAKEALYEVLQTVNDVDFGFASFNQDRLRAFHKHWIYEAVTPGPFVPDIGPFPQVGEREVFGHQFTCDTSDSGRINSNREDDEVGCWPGSDRPARHDDTWERERVLRLAKGGDDFNETRQFYIRDGNDVYRMTYRPVAPVPPATGLGASTLQMQVSVDVCYQTQDSGRECRYTWPAAPTTIVTYRRVEQFFFYEPGTAPSRNTYSGRGFFDQGTSGTAADNTCDGWEGNYDSGNDDFRNINYKFPTVQDPNWDELDRGDFMPLDWTTDNKERVLQRLAPNRALGELVPDFSMARYFEDQPNGNGVLELKDPRARPLMPRGSTPLGASIRDFRTWYAGCSQGNCPNQTGWKDIAAANDPDWGCRVPYLLVISDGDASSCDRPDACSGTAGLRAQEGVKTYVVAFGVENTSGNRLNCMASNGGTGDPIYPQNQQELVDALTRIFGEIKEEARSFASAAVPSVQAAVEDKIYLTSFTPLNDEPTWDGHVDAFLKPLPLVAAGPDAGRPDRNRRCGGARQSGCLAWDAGEQLYQQAVNVDFTANPPNYNMGDDPLERRVFYAEADPTNPVPRQRRLFVPPPDPSDPTNPATYTPEWLDLLFGFGIPDSGPDPIGDLKDVMQFVLEPKSGQIEDPQDETQEITLEYVLGDVFHSNPVVVDSPNNLTYFLQNAGATQVTDPDGTVRTVGGYQDFALRHRVRRKMVLVGTNDGQLHAFDAGTYSATLGDDRDLQCTDALAENRTPRIIETETFTNGTGHELFSFIPREVMPTLTELEGSTSHRYTVDGTVTVADVNIGPLDTVARTEDPDYENAWRTVVMGGLRRGGKSYYALDVTQPDRINEADICALDGIERKTSVSVEQGTGYVPSCLGDLEAGTGSSRCGPRPFPAVMWEFKDIWDEDGDTYADLADTWSVPVVGRIRVCDGSSCDPSVQPNDIEDRFVAIFGGGLDESFPYSGPAPGSFIYMLDVATGEILYKQPVVGMVPSEPAALDSDLDGYIDKLYIGTTAGFLYKVDMGSVPQIQSVSVDPGLSGLPLQLEERIVDTAWEPYQIFDTEGRPIFFPPATIFSADLGEFALAFGTGDRENLWSDDQLPGRFYTILDNNFRRSTMVSPATVTDLDQIGVTAANLASTDNLLVPGPGELTAGWYVELDPRERIITKPFALSGVLFFTAYSPQTVILGEGPGNGNGGNGPNAPDPVCSRTGESRIFVVFATNANALLTVEGLASRYLLVPEFVTDPFAELSTTKNVNPDGTPTDPTDPGSEPDFSDDSCKNMEELTENLKDLFPDTCRFANYTLNIQTVRSDRGLVCIAPVPICIVERNWREL